MDKASSDAPEPKCYVCFLCLVEYENFIALNIWICLSKSQCFFDNI